MYTPRYVMTRPVRLRVKAAPSWRRHFDGWQLLVVVMVVAWGAAAIVVPRPVVPTEIPRERMDPSVVRALIDHDRALAASVETTPLDAHVRRLGSAMRLVGRSEAEADAGIAKAQLDLKTAAQEALRVSVTDVVRLRAYQTEAFLRALATWRTTGERTDDLVELGGAFLRAFEASGWIEVRGDVRDVRMPELVLRTAFKRHWNELEGIKADALVLDHDEEVAFAAFALETPPHPLDRIKNRAALAVYDDQMRLNKIDDLAKLDPSYPRLYAQGIVYFRLSSYELAVQSFARYLGERPEGRYAVRAANYLKASLERGGPLDGF